MSNANTLNEKQTEIKPCYHFNPQMQRRHNINNKNNNNVKATKK